MGAVSYLNTKPLIYGFEQGMMSDEVEMIQEYPSLLAEKLMSDDLDIALLPAGALPSISDYRIISDYCIGATGPVASVCLFSDVPVEKTEEILLDYQSVTSVALVKILLREHWKADPSLRPAASGFEHSISGTTAAVVIGDRALALRSEKKYVYDLAEAWIQLTGLPFVFAAWVTNHAIRPGFEQRFNAATQAGFNHLSDIIAANNSPHYNLETYYTENISYHFDAAKKKGLELFLSKL